MSKFSQQFQKPSLSQNNQTQIMMANQVSLRVLICLDMVFIETLDLYISKVQSWLLILFQQLKKLGLVFQDSFNSFKNPKVSIFNMVSITSLDLNIFLSLDHRESLDSRSWRVKKSQSQSQLVLTVKTPMLTIKCLEGRF